MTLQDWLRHIESCSPQVMNFGLERMHLLLPRLIPKHSAYVVTVGGTNGKGSTVAVLEACLLAAGLQVGAYTSPHLRSVNERVRVQGQDIESVELINAFAAVEAVRGNIPLTYFEFFTLAGVWALQAAGVQVMILEVGLGGRLDAVNAIDPDLSIITSIDLDHQQYLGNSLHQIAIEKCGILRADRPAVYGGAQVIEAVQQQALLHGARLLTQQDFSGQLELPPRPNTWCWRGVDGAGQSLELTHLPMPTVLLSNAACSLQALQLLPAALRPSAQQIIYGLQQVKVLGRLQWERLRLAAVAESTILSPNLLLDVAHNPAAIAQVLIHLRQQDLSRRRVIAVFGVMADKDWPQMLLQLSSIVDLWLPVQANELRALSRDLLVEHLQAHAWPIWQVDFPLNNLIKFLSTHLLPEDLVLVLGSFAVVGPCLQQLAQLRASL